jgi:hypothetical protein
MCAASVAVKSVALELITIDVLSRRIVHSSEF